MFCLHSVCLHPLSYAYSGVVAVTSPQRRNQRLWLGGPLEPPAVSASVLLLAVLPVSVPLLSAGLGSTCLSHCILAGDPSSTHAAPLRPTGPVCSCECKCIVAGVKNARVCVRDLLTLLTAGRSQLQAIGSAQRRLTAGVLLRWHQDVLRHVPERP